MKTFVKDRLVDGKPSHVRCVELDGQTFALSGHLPRFVRLEDEWYHDLRDPHAVVAAMRRARIKADIFSFWQRVPDTEPLFTFPRAWESIATLPVTTFDHWWNRQIKPATRNLVRKSEKKGVEVRSARYDDAFVRGMTEIFNETPIRQGRRFWHYGKDFATIIEQFSRYLFREELIGAYYEGELIGFAMIADAGRYAVVGQIISKIHHRDKSPNNALIAKAVEICAGKCLPHLLYGSWADGSLADFKRHNGFEETRLPRYYVALNTRGAAMVSLGLHHGWRAAIPPTMKTRLKTLRSAWLARAHARGHRGLPEAAVPVKAGKSDG